MGSGDFKRCKIFFCTFKVGIFFFLLGHIFFLARILRNIFFINNFLGEISWGLLPHPLAPPSLFMTPLKTPILDFH